MSLACISDAEAQANPHWHDWLNALADSGRASRLQINPAQSLWLALERLTCLQAIYPTRPIAAAAAGAAGFR